ncbi:carbohydrate kinase [Pelagicoccus sp. SDUM812002]|uniref:carbohydrate kinase family protein n=1 Tax=Pelagicoccus sp. SDUM812002 TaxID=3041266 RepID=UPI00280F9CFC|nr:carbohydrate kinase [Pelagicoccus sp. SDUM812002]MDQ8185277.1 carbohydrate kinase [Pelagicoccus sp. SDUM812002]
MKETNTKIIVTFGEVLWDCLPRGLFLGGAPLNVAYHAGRLGAKSYISSSVGKDFLGDEALRRIEASGIETDLLKKHPHFPTGVSVASLDDLGDATYEIVEKVAWDEIDVGDSDKSVLDSADAIVFGSLATRSPSNFELIKAILESTKALKVCDVNLRPPYDDPDRALELSKFADVLKVNEDELSVLSGNGEAELLEQVQSLHRRTGVKVISVTLGKEGAVLWKNGRFFSLPTEDVVVADTIGAGDSFTAALTIGILEKRRLEVCLKRALKLSSFVASADGAQPEYVAKKVLS